MQLVQPQPDTVAGRAPRVPIARVLFGTALMLAAWGFSWFGPDGVSAHTFFPLWLGYILLVDGIVEARSGTSFRTRNPGAFLMLFLISIPLWWLFEAANVRLQNWHYHVPEAYGWPHRRIEQSIAFSTVLPGVFETAELVQSTRLGRRGARWRRFTPSALRLRMTSVLGLLMIGGVLLFPQYLFPLVWIGGFLIIDPQNALSGRPSLIGSAAQGRWTPAIVLSVAALICGFLWEMWNIRASAKWTYDIPYFDWLHVFEMPILGYGGYIPFAFGLYAAYHLITARLPQRSIARLAIDQRGIDSRETTES